MKAAVEKAGILDIRRVGPTTLDFAPEPEAAALATLAEPGRSLARETPTSSATPGVGPGPL